MRYPFDNTSLIVMVCIKSKSIIVIAIANIVKPAIYSASVNSSAASDSASSASSAGMS